MNVYYRNVLSCKLSIQYSGLKDFTDFSADVPLQLVSISSPTVCTKYTAHMTRGVFHRWMAVKVSVCMFVCERWECEGTG